MLFSKEFYLLLLLASICMSSMKISNGASLAQDEVDVLNQIARTLGATDLNFDADDTCGRYVESVVERDPHMNITCGICTNQSCHITDLVLMHYNLPGNLPPELARLPYIRTIDLAYNYLNGTIPREWASMELEFISVFANRLSGNFPSYLGNMSSLRYLDLETNQFYGEIPPELGNLVNLETLRLSSNRLTGSLPMELSELRNLSDFRINDNNFTGSLPDLFQNLKKLVRLEIQGSGISGPIPTSISTLESLNNLKISDLSGMNQEFPDLSNLTALNQLVLKNCNIVGLIPEFIWRMSSLRSLDLSFNHLVGNISSIIATTSLKLVFLTGNSLRGGIPESILRTGTAVDLSYNNFTWESSNSVACRRRMDPNLNLFRSSSAGNPAGIPCLDDFKCDRYWHSFYVNCGGNDGDINGTKYVGDATAVAGSAMLYEGGDNWGFSSSGDFRDDDDELNAPSRFLASNSNMSNPFSTARISPLSLTYYRYCLENGSYSIRLHFAEIQFTNDTTYASLGRRMFDIYIQDERVEKDFDIEAEAGGPLRPVTKRYTVNVTRGVLQIRFYWAGKGTQAIPFRGVHGPLISAISVDAGFKPRFAGKKNNKTVIVVSVLCSCLALSVLAYLCWRYYFSTKIQADSRRMGLSIGTFTLRQIKAATDDFDSSNKIGEGGFGPVFKGQLPDGRLIAVKQLSTKSSQGNREFMNEMGIISCLQHPNLVKLYGCCVEGDQLMLVYEYLENNCLSRALFGQGNSRINLDWQTRHRICTGIAKGLAFLNEESRIRIIHRDIKGTNVLLDGDLNPKISDFGLAKLREEGKTHVSTRVAGTFGYIAPEYALWGFLTHKADVYSFGILALEIVSGKQNTTYGPEDKYTCLLDWACNLQQAGNLLALVDDKLRSEFNHEEAERIIKAALLCTKGSPGLRPNMTDVVGMLEGRVTIPDEVHNGDHNNQDMRFKMIRDHHDFMQNQSSSGGTQPPHNSASSSST